MRGRITIIIRRRVITQSTYYKDKWKKVDTLRLYSDKKGKYIVVSKFSEKKFLISRDELAFVRFLCLNYGFGDYSILIFSKGKERGFRRFWDGIIMENKRFLRRKEMSFMKDMSGGKKSPYEAKASESVKHTTSYISRYMKTKQPGRWHNF